MDLIVVESPTKAKTLGKFLGADYRVVASYGHVQDLPQKTLGIDILHDFKPEYVQTVKQKEKMDEIRKMSDSAKVVYLATDPDREGEAIAAHVADLMKGNTQNFKRIAFHEITEKAIKEALEHPKKIDEQLVDAQTARRVLDRLVGYKLSPLLWRKIRRGLSAGRVQSVAVKLIVEREREIEAFKPDEYWNLWVEVIKAGETSFKVQLVERNGEKYKISTAQQAESAAVDLRTAQYQVAGVEKKDTKRTPPPPFTTSTLQQAAANKIGWSAKKTMQAAQGLYEEGYITYHRTDSTNLAEEAVKNCAEFIVGNYGQEYALEKPRVYKTKSKVAQEAHEAIRPTNVEILGTKSGVHFGNHDQEKLYELIWRRFVAGQMTESRGESVKVRVSGNTSNGSYGLEAKGETILFPGWTKLYENESAEGEDEDKQEKIPQVSEGEKLEFVDLTTQQKFTQPPARYNDAGLIKILEEMGIGRPSTYAPTLTTIADRQYVERIENKRFKPTALGIAVNDFLVTNFPAIVDYKFTANMEDELDNIANGERLWQPVIGNFYQPLAEMIEKVGESTARVKVEVEETGESCPLCHEGQVVVRIGKFGKFLACSRYPECKYKATYLNKAGVKCPKCMSGEVIIKKTKSGKSFYGCSNYPNCDFAAWNKPVPAEVKEEVKNES